MVGEQKVEVEGSASKQGRGNGSANFTGRAKDRDGEMLGLVWGGKDFKTGF